MLTYIFFLTEIAPETWLDKNLYAGDVAKYLSKPQLNLRSGMEQGADAQTLSMDIFGNF